MTGLVNWLLNRGSKRTDELPEGFPAEWRVVLWDEVPFFEFLPADADREQLKRDVYWFVKQKAWTPYDIEITERMQVIIAAHACLLINRRLDLGVFPRTRELIIRSAVFGPQTDAIDPTGVAHAIRSNRIGEAWYRGPIVLSWSAIAPLVESPYPRGNVVIHEFAHALDHLDGATDGTPPLESKQELRAWVTAFTQAYEALRRARRDGGPMALNPYGATNPAEFFAVVSEQFFTRPRQLRETHPAVYAQLQRFYQHDPASWLLM